MRVRCIPSGQRTRTAVTPHDFTIVDGGYSLFSCVEINFTLNLTLPPLLCISGYNFIRICIRIELLLETKILHTYVPNIKSP